MYQTVACLRHPNFRTASAFSRACLSPSAQYAAAASKDGNIYVWDIARSTTTASPTATAAESESVGKAMGGGAAVGGGAVAAVLGRHGSAAIGCDWRLNAPNMLASCDAAGGVRVWG